MSYIARNIHSGHRFWQVYVAELDDTLSADIDNWPARAFDVRWRFRGRVASCATPEAARAAFRMALIGTRFEHIATPSESEGTDK